nr:unnamed protein product [Callosobruchus analis]
MEVNRLKGDELTYELEIRGLPIGNTVSEKRCLLREAFRKERLKVKEVPSRCNRPTHTELAVCSDKLDELKISICDFDGSNKENEFRRIYTRLCHVSSRLTRLVCDTEQEVERYKLSRVVEQLICELNMAYAELQDEQDANPPSDAQPRGKSYDFLLDSPPAKATSELATTVDQHVTQPGDISYDLVDAPIPETEVACQQFSNLKLPQHGSVAQDYFSGDSRDRCCTATPRSSSVVPLHNQHAIHYRDRPSPTTEKASQSHRVSYLNTPGTHYDPPMKDLSPNDRHPSFPLNGKEQAVYPSHTESRYQYLDVGKWNVRFSGRGSVTEFIERVEELRLSRGVSKERLTQSAVEFFSHEALLWFRTVKFTSWDDLCEQLRQTFQPYDYEYELWNEIRQRTQGADEKVVNFVVVMGVFSENYLLLCRSLPR